MNITTLKILMLTVFKVSSETKFYTVLTFRDINKVKISDKKHLRF